MAMGCVCACAWLASFVVPGCGRLQATALCIIIFGLVRRMAGLARQDDGEAGGRDEQTANMPSAEGKTIEEPCLASLQKAYTNEGKEDTPEGPPEDWGRLRRFCYMVLQYKVKHTPVIDVAVAIVVLLNMCILSMEVDHSARCVATITDMPCNHALWLSIIDDMMLAFYCAEVFIRGNVARCDYLKKRWNYIDMFVITSGIVHAGLDQFGGVRSVGAIRVLRIIRLARLFKFFKWVPTLWNFLSGMVGAVQAMFWGFLLIFLMLFIWALLAVEFLNPIAWHVFDGSDPWCQLSFSAMSRATLFMFATLITGDNWGQCAVPIMEYAPVTALIFGTSFLTVQLGFLNLLLAVIVDQSAVAREKQTAERLEEHRAQTTHNFLKWEYIMRDMDVDRSGTVSLDEFKQAYAKDELVQAYMTELGCEGPDIQTIFELMDLDRGGTLSYSEFITSMMKTLQKPSFSMAIIELRLQRLDHMVGTELAQRLQSMERRMTDAVVAAVERCLQPDQPQVQGTRRGGQLRGACWRLGRGPDTRRRTGVSGGCGRVCEEHERRLSGEGA